METFDDMRWRNANGRNEDLCAAVNGNSDQVVKLSVGVIMVRFPCRATDLWQGEIDTEWEGLIGQILFELINDLMMLVVLRTISFQHTS